MNEGRTVFAQLMDELPKYEFDKCVRRYRGDHRVRSLSSYEQFLVMGFAQLTYRESLRDIETCLRALGSKLYHSGIHQPTARSTLADANEKRDWRIFSDFAHVLIEQARLLYAEEPFGAELKQAAYALDSTTIDLCLSLFPWAKFRRHKAAIKLHTLLTLRGCFPTVVILTTGKVHDVNILDQLVCEAGSFYIVDRGYLDFGRLHRIHRSGAFFVTRAKKNARFQRRYSRPVDKSTGLRFDQTVVLTGFRSRQQYPDTLRRIGFRDPQTGKRFVFLTNNFTEPALTIAQLYRCRWQIGSNCSSNGSSNIYASKPSMALPRTRCGPRSGSPSPCMSWSPSSKKRFRLSASLYTILQILSLTLFEKTPILQALAQQTSPTEIPDTHDQPCLPGF